MLLPKEIKTKKIQKTFFIFFLLLILSFSFLVIAKENSSSSQNIFLDSDQDGLSDEEEKTYGTDPQNKDTDGDSYSDGVEVKSGYNPLIPSPGDKIVPEENSQNFTNETQTNLTKNLAKEILNIAEKYQANGGEINTETIQALVDKTLSPNLEESEENTFTPLITKDDIRIKEQNYSGLSEKKQMARMREDASEYLAAIYYILASNSPEPITSGSDINAVINSVAQKITQAFTTRSTQKVSELKESGEKMIIQIKDVEVPEDMLDIHTSALSFAKYAIEMEKYITPNANDPLTDIQNLSQVSGLISNMISFTSQIEEKLNEYELTEADVRGKLGEMGLDYF